MKAKRQASDLRQSMADKTRKQARKLQGVQVGKQQSMQAKCKMMAGNKIRKEKWSRKKLNKKKLNKKARKLAYKYKNKEKR